MCVDTHFSYIMRNECRWRPSRQHHPPRVCGAFVRVWYTDGEHTNTLCDSTVDRTQAHERQPREPLTAHSTRQQRSTHNAHDAANAYAHNATESSAAATSNTHTARQIDAHATTPPMMFATLRVRTHARTFVFRRRTRTVRIMLALSLACWRANMSGMRVRECATSVAHWFCGGLRIKNAVSREFNMRALCWGDTR